MSKTSQRRLAQEQVRNQVRKKALQPREHLAELIVELAYRAPEDAKWRLYCERINADPQHEDRAKLADWLESLAKKGHAAVQIARLQALRSSYNFDSIDGLDIAASAEAAHTFGGRLFSTAYRYSETGTDWFDPMNEALLHPKEHEEHSILSAILTSKLSGWRLESPDIKAIGCLFLIPESGLPAVYAGMTASGAFAAVFAQGTERYVARSFAVAEMAFVLANMTALPPLSIPTPMHTDLIELVDLVRGCSGDEINDPAGRPTQGLNAILRRWASNHVALQVGMSIEIEALRSVLEARVYESEELAESLADAESLAEHERMTGARARNASAARIRELESRVAALQTTIGPHHTPPAAPAAAAPESSLRQKMGVFFGQG